MSHKAIVLDANILIRAVLGKRVRELLFEHAATGQFLHLAWPMPMPASTFPDCWKSAASAAPPPWRFWTRSNPWFGPFNVIFMTACGIKPFSELPCAMPTTGRCWPVRWRWTVWYGRKTPTFLERVWRRGPATGWLCIWWGKGPLSYFFPPFPTGRASARRHTR